MRRHLSTLAIALTAVTVAVGVLPATSAGAQGCAGDRVTASMSSSSVSGPAWSVTGACVDARDYFVGEAQGHAFAIGISTVTYDDGHVGRLAFLSVRVDAAQAVTVLAMEDPRTGQLHFAGTVRQAAIGVTGATVSGAGIGFPPLESATVSLDFADAAAPWPDWATGSTTVPAESPTSLPGTETTTSLPAEAPLGATTVAPSVSTPTTTVPSVTSTLPSVTSVPTIPGVDPQPVP